MNNLEYIKNQTAEICAIAIRNNPVAIKYYLSRA